MSVITAQCLWLQPNVYDYSPMSVITAQCLWKQPNVCDYSPMSVIDYIFDYVYGNLLKISLFQ